MSKVYQFMRKQVIKTDIETAWDFMRSPANLNKITPPDMTFTILSDLPDVMFEGQIIRYKIKIPLIVPITSNYCTERIRFQNPPYFLKNKLSICYCIVRSLSM